MRISLPLDERGAPAAAGDPPVRGNADPPAIVAPCEIEHVDPFGIAAQRRIDVCRALDPMDERGPPREAQAHRGLVQAEPPRTRGRWRIRVDRDHLEVAPAP